MRYSFYLILFIITLSSCGYSDAFFKPNVEELKDDKMYIYVKSDKNYSTFLNHLKKSELLINFESFEKAADFMNLKENLKPGRYKVDKDMNNRQIINLIKSGKQTPVRFSWQSVRKPEFLAAKIASALEADSTSVMTLLKDNNRLSSDYDADTNTILCRCLPDTYEYYWNTDAEGFMKKQYQTYKKFWNPDRLKKAEDLGLNPDKVCILASIVVAEQSRYSDEWPIIAGLYLNRLKNNMMLQSDPTLLFAANDFTARRVYDSHKETDSPYNTYKYTGLPPGPILTPSASALDAVLNAADVDYLYMCAKDDLSGRHNFSKSYAQHQVYANAFRRALDNKGIH